MVTCPQCGQILKEDMRFCTKCGFALKNLNLSSSDNSVPGIECLKCGSQSNLSLYTHTETVTTAQRRHTSYVRRSIKVPFCRTCHVDITNWKQSHPKTETRSSYAGLILLTFFGVMIGGSILIHNPWITVIIFLLLALGYIIKSWRKIWLRKQENSPFRYIKFRMRTTYVRPQGQGKWIRYDWWLNNITKGNQFAFQ